MQSSERIPRFPPCACLRRRFAGAGAGNPAKMYSSGGVSHDQDDDDDDDDGEACKVHDGDDGGDDK